MSAVLRLANLLARSQAAAAPDAPDPAPSTELLDALIDRLSRRVSAGSAAREPVDLQCAAVERFWGTGRVETLRDARLLAFGLGLPAGPGGISLLDDKTRLEAVLLAADSWLDHPRWYRRCFQGLVWSYFNHPAADDESLPTAPNWLRLRDYLLARLSASRGGPADPDWLKTLDAHRGLFGPSPCAEFLPALLAGDRSGLDALCAQLGIGEGSWLPSAMIRAQVVEAVRLDHPDFTAILPRLLGLLSGGLAWRESGIALLLERHAQIARQPLHDGLRDAVLQAWGSPWSARAALQWDGLGTAARQLAGDAIKALLIDRFFARMGPAGARRAEFWKRYAQAIQRIEVARPPAAPLEESEPGPTVCLRDAAPGDAAMILFAGSACLVMDADPASAVWAYDLRQAAPFDMAAPLALALDSPNSLHRSSHRLLLAHEDGRDGWRHWEQAFEARLSDCFGLRAGAAAATDALRFVDLSDGSLAGPSAPAEPEPDPAGRAWPTASNGEDVHWQTAEAMNVPYSRPDLEVLARVHGLTLKPGGPGRGRVRVAPAGVDAPIARVLQGWGFTRAPDGDWLR